MGQARSRLDEAKRELALTEARGDTPQVILKLRQVVRISLAQGELEQAVEKLDAILQIQEEQLGRKSVTAATVESLEIAETLYFLGNTLRLLLARENNPGQRSVLFQRGYEVLQRSLEIRSHAAAVDRLALVAKTKSALVLLQQAFGADAALVHRLHEEALDSFAQVPLASDAMQWTFEKGVWTALNTSAPPPPLGNSTSNASRPTSLLHPVRASRASISQLLFSSKPNHQLLLADNSNRSNRASLLEVNGGGSMKKDLLKHSASRRRSETSPELYDRAASMQSPSDPQLLSIAISRGPASSASSAAFVPVPPAPRVKPSWRLVLRSSSLHHGSVVGEQQAAKRGAGFLQRYALTSTGMVGAAVENDLEEGVLRTIDLEPGKEMELGLGLGFPPVNSSNVTYVPIAPKNERYANFLVERHCTLHEEVVEDGLAAPHNSMDNAGEDDAKQRCWVITDTVRARSKNKGVIVNRVRVTTCPLRVGDVIQIGNCGKIKVGHHLKPQQQQQRAGSVNGKDEPEFFGLEYEVQRIVSAVDSADVNSLAPPKLFPGDNAYRYFHVTCVAAQVNLKGQPLRDEYIQELFAGAVKNGIPYYQWDSYVFAELARARLLL